MDGHDAELFRFLLTNTYEKLTSNILTKDDYCIDRYLRAKTIVFKYYFFFCSIRMIIPQSLIWQVRINMHLILAGDSANDIHKKDGRLMIPYH